MTSWAEKPRGFPIRFLNTIIIKGLIISNQKTVANKFNDYFINVAPSLLKDLGEYNNEFQDYLKNPNKHSFFLKEADPKEVHKLLLKIDTKKSSDIFGISPKLTKLSAEFIKRHLSLIFNEPFKEGIVPNKLKSAIVHPIHKGDSSMICANYRPILILPILGKILEKLVHKRLINYLDKYELLFKHQYGFQKGKSTERAILHLYKNVVEAIEKKRKHVLFSWISLRPFAFS